jgi:hypothetical protein
VTGEEVVEGGEADSNGWSDSGLEEETRDQQSLFAQSEARLRANKIDETFTFLEDKS